MAAVVQIIIFWISTQCSVIRLQRNLMPPSLASPNFVRIDAEVDKGAYFLPPNQFSVYLKQTQLNWRRRRQQVLQTSEQHIIEVCSA